VGGCLGSLASLSGAGMNGGLNASKPTFPGCAFQRWAICRFAGKGKAPRARTSPGGRAEPPFRPLRPAFCQRSAALDRSWVAPHRSGCRRFFALDPHAENGGGLGLNRSIRRKISANGARGTATSASWNTT
jgi:hypothetical protein